MTDFGTYAFWALAASAFLALVSILLKLKWWRYSMGYWLLILAGEICFITLFIFFLQIGLVPKFAREQYRLIIYGSLMLVILWLIFDIWRKNWRHWAWSEED